MNANEIFEQQQQSRRNYEMLGVEPTALMMATVEEIQSHIDMIANIAEAYKVNLDPSKFAYGCTSVDVVAKAEAKTAANRRSAGARALVAKYGYDAACRITGKTLQR